ncbi:putative GNAT family acetyltransferase [Plectosphaerella plurivora]|uniref:GNAT family acetyltransferase n=1 Tax=Plectosphaerella plurivora TaxID=936078 RepID=A0A9P8V3F9_9PEZI|nr:putative GNAT family acetyltransferase [Plectosphaerella plurivora]
MHIRHATLDDLPAVADVILASLAEDSSWKSLFPPDFRKNPAYEAYTLEVLARYLDPENQNHLVVVAEVSRATAKGLVTTIASVAVWDMSQAEMHDTWRKSIDTLFDVDDLIAVMAPAASPNVRDKLATMHAAVSFSQRQHFENAGAHAYLEALATHPAYRGQGYAKALSAVGLESARARGLAVAVMTSSRGYIFFSGLAFADLGCVSLRGPDRSREDCVLKVMILPAPRPKARRRGSSMLGSLLSIVGSPRS